MLSHIRFISSLVALHLFPFGILLPEAKLTGWIEEQAPSVDLTANSPLDWIHGGFNGDYTKLNRKARAGLISALTISSPSNNGALVRSQGATFSWSDGSPDAFCSGTTAGVHAQGQSNSIRFSVPADATPRTVKIYFSSVHSAVTVTAHLSDGSAPDWVNGDWYATTGTITPVATLSYSAASPNQTLSVTLAVAAGNDWPSVGIHAVTLRGGATAIPTPPKPPAPTGVYASARNGRVIVQWDQMPRVDSYSIYRSSTSILPSTPWRTTILPVQDNHDIHMLVAADTAATNGTAWHYWVSSVTAGGETPASSPVTAIPSDPGTTVITRTRRLSIMPLGDSITFGFPFNGGYRQRLLDKLAADGYQVQMAGRVKNNSSGVAQPFHEGWPGRTIEYIRDGVVDPAVSTYQPDIILLMIGTNNLAWGDKTQSDVDAALAAYDGLIARIFSNAPNTSLVISPILPLAGTNSNGSSKQSLVDSFNQGLLSRVNTVASQGKRISWASQMSAIKVGQLGDGVHPTPESYPALGDAWFEAIRAITAGTPTGQVSLPSLSPAPGTFATAQSVSISCLTSGAAIHFTTDGSIPTGASPTFGTPITISSSATIKAVALMAGMTDSSIATGIYVISPSSAAPSITTQPTGQSVTVGQTATFTVTASGNPAPSYQWQRNGSNISGATSASYTTPATVIGDDGATFRCVATNSSGSATSNAARLGAVRK